jgi:hypothetical protein
VLGYSTTIHPAASPCNPELEGAGEATKKVLVKSTHPAMFLFLKFLLLRKTIWQFTTCLLKFQGSLLKRFWE